MRPSTLKGPKAQPVLGTGTYFGTCHQRGKTIQRNKRFSVLTEKGERVGRCHCGLHVFLSQAN